MSGCGSGQTTKRSLPSWMSSRESNISDEEFKGDGDSSKTNRSSHKRTREDNGAAWQNSADSNTKIFSKLLEGVVFVLSGFVNPERGMLRSQALEMGAEYQQDWNSNCTLLVCAFPNTPKFRQVEAQCGTIVSKEWITECHTQKKLVDIDSYLMYAGKPWRKSNTCRVLSNDDSTSPSLEAQERDKGLRHEAFASRGESSNSVGVELSPTRVKKWATDDLNKTSAWLESQNEKPEADELKEVAAQGVLTCLQDAIDLLKQKQDLSQIRDQWSIIPRVVEELIRSGSSERTTMTHQHNLHRQALSYKKMYEDEFRKMEGNSNMKGKATESNSRKDRSGILKTEYDSDDTVEMTEEEIDLAFRNISRK